MQGGPVVRRRHSWHPSYNVHRQCGPLRLGVLSDGLSTTGLASITGCHPWPLSLAACPAATATPGQVTAMAVVAGTGTGERNAGDVAEMEGQGWLTGRTCNAGALQTTFTYNTVAS